MLWLNKYTVANTSIYSIFIYHTKYILSVRLFHRVFYDYISHCSRPSRCLVCVCDGPTCNIFLFTSVFRGAKERKLELPRFGSCNRRSSKMRFIGPAFFVAIAQNSFELIKRFEAKLTASLRLKLLRTINWSSGLRKLNAR